MAVHSDCWPLIPYLYLLPLGFMNFSVLYTRHYKPQAVSVTDNLCNKQGNLSLKSAVYNGERVIIAHVRYVLVSLLWGYPLPLP